MSPKNDTEAPTAMGIEEEIGVLDREAREALDALADKRAELQRQLEATERAAERQRERDAERRRREQEEAERKAGEEAKARQEKIAAEVRQLEAEREGLATRLREINESLAELDERMVQEVSSRDTEHANRLILTYRGRHRRWIKERFGA